MKPHRGNPDLIRIAMALESIAGMMAAHWAKVPRTPPPNAMQNIFIEGQGWVEEKDLPRVADVTSIALLDAVEGMSRKLSRPWWRFW